MRETTKPSTAQCNLYLYTLFLLSEPKLGGCSRLAEILGDVSHDSVNRFLLRERYEPKDFRRTALNQMSSSGIHLRHIQEINGYNDLGNVIMYHNSTF